jgi:hypothetical protein
LLEVARDFVKPVTVVEIVNHVAGVEELRNGQIDVVLGRLGGRLIEASRGVILELKLEACTCVGTIIVDPVVSTLPVLVSKDLNENEYKFFIKT